MTDSNEIYEQAMTRLKNLLQTAKDLGLPEPAVASLATADKSARPSVRMVYIHAIEPEGVVFFTNINSEKGQQLTDNPCAALCFFWPQTKDQAIVEGAVELLSEEASNSYWNARSRESKLAIWASQRHDQLKGKKELAEELRKYKDKFGFQKVPRPQDWRAFRVLPDRIEFWSAEWKRPRPPLVCRRKDDGTWTDNTSGS